MVNEQLPSVVRRTTGRFCHRASIQEDSFRRIARTYRIENDGFHEPSLSDCEVPSKAGEPVVASNSRSRCPLSVSLVYAAHPTRQHKCTRKLGFYALARRLPRDHRQRKPLPRRVAFLHSPGRARTPEFLGEVHFAQVARSPSCSPSFLQPVHDRPNVVERMLVGGTGSPLPRNHDDDAAEIEGIPRTITH